MMNILDVFSLSKSAADSVRTALLDTAGKTDVEKEFITKIDAVTSTPVDELLSTLLRDAIQFGIKVLAALAIYVIGAWIIKLIKKSLRRFFARRKAEPAIESFVMSLVTAMLWVIVIIITVGALGVETTSLAALLAAGGMAVGMALSGTVQNFAGGLMILIFKPFKAGDYIEAMGFAGTVSEVNITSTKIVTVDNRVVILPNGPLQSGSVNNYSRMEHRRVDFTIGVEYGSDSEAVKTALLDIASSDSRVLTAGQGAPADPFAALSSLSASSVDFTLRVWVKSADYWGVFFDLNEKIYKTLPAAGIEFPFPQVSVHLDK